MQCESAILDDLRGRNEAAFADFVVRHGAAMRRIAAAITRDLAIAEEAVQETWLAVLKGLDRFEARSSLRTWVFRILVNRARSIVAREMRTVPFSSLESAESESGLPAERFAHPMAPGHWTVPLPEWHATPEEALLSREAREQIARAITGLPPAQREVVTLRDVEGWDAADVCNVLEISEVHQRVLLHRARTRLRSALETYFTRG